MSESIIQVENLGKKYIIGHQQQRARSFRDLLTQRTASLGQKFSKPFSRELTVDSGKEEFWALRDLSFDIKQGEVVGIIGRNGAGKSTLLKILSRITEPTTGRVILNGRVASLLEVGTGFHAELTGRENIFLNGAILGMSRAEIKRKFDEIVDFAGVEKFLDTPVKRYSSGMYVRLAFAVAAHLEPEILVVDEVLAVGDAEFQKKCLGKMSEVSKQEGRTVLFVSHQMAAISNLCPSCIVLDNGQLSFRGKTDVAIQHYLNSARQTPQDNFKSLSRFRPSWAKPYIKSARVLDTDENEVNSFPLGSNITFELSFETPTDQPLKAPVMGVVINHAIFGTVGGVNTRMSGFWTQPDMYTSATLRCTLPKVFLLQGDYTVNLWLGDGSVDIDGLANYLSFQIEESDIYNSGQPPFGNMGVVFFEPQWQLINRTVELLAPTSKVIS